MTYNIIIPTLEKLHLVECLNSIADNTKHSCIIRTVTEGDTWAEAVNIGIDEFEEEDVILIDDDVVVSKGWLDNIEKYKEQADIIGWSLKRPNGSMQFAGCYFYKTMGGVFMANHYNKIIEPQETPNVTTSCVYIKRKVFDKIGKMDNESYKEGCHYEDSDFCYRAKKAGFKIIVIPEIVEHKECASKPDKYKDFKKRVSLNGQIFYNKINNDKDYIKQMKNEGFVK